MRVQFNGRTSAFQADYVGSIPITRSIKMRQQLSWIEQLPSKQQARGSSPFWRATLLLKEHRQHPLRFIFGGCSSVGQSTGLWFRVSRVRVPLPTPLNIRDWERSQSLIPFLHTGVQPSGKARDFDSLTRWFESSHPCQSVSGGLYRHDRLPALLRK